MSKGRFKRRREMLLGERDASQWANEIISIAPYCGPEKPDRILHQLRLLGHAIRSIESDADLPKLEDFCRQLRQLMRRKLRYYAAQEKRAMIRRLQEKGELAKPKHHTIADQVDKIINEHHAHDMGDEWKLKGRIIDLMESVIDEWKLGKAASPAKEEV